MTKHFLVNDDMFCAENPQVKNNTFIGQKTNDNPLPKYDDVKQRLPRPVWDGHDDVIRCYDKAWQLAFGNLRKAKPEAGFVSDFIDTAFNGYLFMWDSSFILMFGKYAGHIFNFQQTLDNFYANQHKDGFICREICESEPGAQFTRDDPVSTGPNIMPWVEWDYFMSTGDKQRISRVFDPLCAYHRWLQLNRSWPDGSYWSSGFACGMDNLPRTEAQYNNMVSHGFMSWIDTCAQQYLSADILIKMAKLLGREDEVQWLKDEKELLYNTVNNKMWDEKTAFYYDTMRDGAFSGVKTVGAYWTLMSDLAPSNKLPHFIAHLDNPAEFKRKNRIPALSADCEQYSADGDYWCGGVWAPTNYMTMCGLNRCGYFTLAHEIACDYLKNVVEVFNQSGTLYENYAPESAAHGTPAKKDFVGWTGLAPISILFEYVFGIQPDAMNRRITWRVSLTERHGICGYRLGDATVDLICEARDSAEDEPIITVKSDLPVTVDIIWGENTRTVKSE